MIQLKLRNDTETCIFHIKVWDITTQDIGHADEWIGFLSHEMVVWVSVNSLSQNDMAVISNV